MTEQEIKEMVEEREAKANAQLLEMVGDIPEADVKPPDNVLFVCKLNPVTTAEDLEIIFSRFGSILSCEVIKDQKTGESLQYAFIEFEKPEDCENAYFKMDNVLIDDRRIHVDFSQSVAKVKHEFKGKEKKEMEEDRPKYVLKSQERKDDKYDLVYEHDDLPDLDSRSRKKHKHNKKGSSSEEAKKQDYKKKKSKKHKRSRSRSPVQRQEKYPETSRGQKSRSKSPVYEKQYKEKKRRERTRSSSAEDEGRRDRQREENRGHFRSSRRDDRRDRDRHERVRERR